ncbi:MAG: hypothetical protein ACYCYO_17360 [Bacilli bacterium]
MKRMGIILANASLALVLSGCATPVVSPPSTAHPATNRAGFQDAAARHGLSARELASLGVQGKLPLFGGKIERLSPLTAPSALPSGYKARVQFKTAPTEVIPYTPQEFHTVDAWRGTLYGKPFTLDVYQNAANDKAAYAQHQPHLYMVGVSYNGRPLQAVVFNQPIWWVRFTANFVTFAAPNPANGNPVYALDLTTGQFLTNQTAIQIAGYWNEMRGGYSGEIAGLPFSTPSEVGAAPSVSRGGSASTTGLEHSGFPTVIRQAMDPLTKSPPVPLLAPTVLAVPNQTAFISARTVADRDHYGIGIYALPSPVPVNSAKLNNLYQSEYASFGGMGFESPIWAQRSVRAPLPLVGVQRAINLGNGIQGVVYQSKGSTVIVWREGRWTIELGDYFTPAPNVNLARQMVAYLHTHFLPVPDAKGVIMARLHPGGNSSFVEWTHGKTEYDVASYQSPLLALEMAVSMRPYYAQG